MCVQKIKKDEANLKKKQNKTSVSVQKMGTKSDVKKGKKKKTMNSKPVFIVKYLHCQMVGI